MRPYTSLAKVYDTIMDDVPYDEWVDYVCGFTGGNQTIENVEIKPKLVLDLCCGTGNISKRLYDKGYDVIGIDSSPDMLALAKQKSEDVLYLMQDATDFELYGTVDAVFCLCDGLNYIQDEDDLLKVFKLVDNYLNSGGVFIFDINTEYKFKHILADKIFAYSTDELNYIWENFYDSEERLNEYYVKLFIKRDDVGNDHSLYEMFEETHYQRSYQLKEIYILLGLTNLKIESVYEAYTMNEPTETSERVCFVCRK